MISKSGKRFLKTKTERVIYIIRTYRAWEQEHRDYHVAREEKTSEEKNGRKNMTVSGEIPGKG